MQPKHTPRNRLAKPLPYKWREHLISLGVPKRKYTAVCKATLLDGRTIDELIVEQGWILYLTREGLEGTREERIDFDPNHIEELELIQFV